ncbi:10198_t:CDS:1, partial [Scutellospora calospora]
ADYINPSLNCHSELQLILSYDLIFPGLQLCHVPRCRQVSPTDPRPLLTSDPHADIAAQTRGIRQDWR